MCSSFITWLISRFRQGQPHHPVKSTKHTNMASREKLFTRLGRPIKRSADSLFKWKIQDHTLLSYKGVPQGSVLDTFLYTLYMALLAWWHNSKTWLSVPPVCGWLPNLCVIKSTKNLLLCRKWRLVINRSIHGWHVINLTSSIIIRLSS